MKRFLPTLILLALFCLPGVSAQTPGNSVADGLTAPLIFEDKAIEIHIGAIDINEKGEVFVEISGDFDIATKNAPANDPLALINYIMRVNAVADNATIDHSSLIGGEGGFHYNWKLDEGVTAKFRNLQFVFPVPEPGVIEQVIVSNDHCRATFDAKTKRLSEFVLLSIIRKSRCCKIVERNDKSAKRSVPERG